VNHHRELSAAAEHSGNVLDIQARGEYAYAALGPRGLRVYDIANIDNKASRKESPPRRSRPSANASTFPRKMQLLLPRQRHLASILCGSNCLKTKKQPIHLLYGFSLPRGQRRRARYHRDPNLKSKSPGVGTLLDGSPAKQFLEARSRVSIRAAS